MGSLEAGVTLHIDENTGHDDREKLRDTLPGMEGVMAAAFHDEKPHLMVVVYDPSLIESIGFVNAAKTLKLHCELIR